MKVALVTSLDEQCGIAVYSRELAEALRVHADIDIVPVGKQFFKSGLVVKLMRVMETAAKKPISPEVQDYLVKNKGLLKRLVAAWANMSDLIHVQFQYPFFGGLAPHKCWFPYFLKEFRRPVVVTLHELDLHGSGWKRWLKRWFNKRLFVNERVDRFIVHTQAMKKQLCELGVREERVTVIPMWVPKVDPPNVSAEEAKRRLGLDARIVIGVFGFVVRRRGYELLLDALNPMPPDTMLVVAGGKHPLDRTSYFDELMNRIAARPDKERIKVTGYLADEKLPLYFAAFDFVAAPFTELAASASLLRCIAYGKPVIASDLPANIELNERAHCLLLFPTGDANALRSCIQELLSNSARRQELTQAALAYAQAYPVSKAAELTLQVYEQVVGSSKAAIRNPKSEI